MNELQVKTMEEMQVIEKMFELEQRKAKAMLSGKILPATFRDVGDVIVLNEMSRVLQIPMILLAQQLYLVHGKVGFSGQFSIALLNKAMEMGKLDNWKYEERKDGAVRVVGERKGKELEGIWIDEDLVKRNGWISNPHWQKNFALMARYRAATWFLRMYYPEMLMGLYTVDEIKDAENEDEVKENVSIETAEAEIIDPLKVNNETAGLEENKEKEELKEKDEVKEKEEVNAELVNNTNENDNIKSDYENEQDEVREEIPETVTKGFLRVYYSKLSKEQKAKFLQVKGDANFDEMSPKQLKDFYMEVKDEIDRMGN
jgi:hypothetical protein